jgi:ABC-type oligopeptide transport system substrate-binding subunit
MNPTRILHSFALPVVVLTAASLTLAACGGSGDSASSSSAATSEPPAPNPNPDGDCSEEALNSAASNATGGTFGGVEEFTCGGGYAVVQGKMNDQYLPLLFKAEDGTWVPVEIQNACQAGEVPAVVAEIACA